MPRRLAAFLACALFFLPAAQALDSFAGTGYDSEYTIPIEVSSVSESPASVTFKFWRAGQYDIYRKAPSGTNWGSVYASTAAGATSWTDAGVALGTEYEYRFKLVAPDPPAASDGFPSGDIYNYLRAGVRIDRTGSRGRIALLVAQDLVANLPQELALYEQDLVGDGWVVHRIETVRGDTVKGSADPFTDTTQFAARTHTAIRDQIKALHASYGSELKQVMILGRVPCPRSGLYTFGPDGHGSKGAVGADGYYADVNNDAYWTDSGSNSGYTGTKVNIPNDGKFDPDRSSTTDLSLYDLGFSRMDLGMRRDEFALIKNFLDKLHRYKHADPSFRPGRKFYFRDGFDNPGEIWWHSGAAISGLANMEAPVGVVPAHPTLGADEAWSGERGPYLFYNRGSGSPGIGTGGKAVIWIGMQSNYGYWFDSDAMPVRLGEDSFTLSWAWTIWGQRYFYHPLGTGDVMGEMMRISANNRGINTTDGIYRFDTDYDGNGNATGLMFMNHMGDAAMRLFMFPPPSSLAVDPTGSGAQLSWTASTEPGLLGYHVYRSSSASGPFTRLTADPVAGTSYTDAATTSGTWTYMVRAVKLENTGSGTHLNGSQGIFRTVSWDAPAPLAVTTSALPDAYLRTGYATTLVATGGVPPYAWSIASGAFPAGLALDPVAGVISGTPSGPGTANFTVQAADVKGVAAVRALSIAVQNAVAYEVPILADARAESWNDSYDGYSASYLFNYPTNRGYYLKYDLSAVPPGTVTKATLRVVLMDPTVTSGTLTINLTSDANDVWAESVASGSSTSTAPSDFLTRNNRPPINGSAPAGVYSGTFPNCRTIDIDLTGLVQHDWANDAGKILGLTASLSAGTAYIATQENSNAAMLAPKLFVYVQGNPPTITLDSPASGQAVASVNQALALATTVADDGLPGGGVTVAWSKVSGPGTATFSDPGAADTTVSFDAAGSYVIRITASDGAMSGSEDIAVTVNDSVLPAGPVPDICWLNFEETAGTTAANHVAGQADATLINATAAAWIASGKTGRGLDLAQESGIAHVLVAADGQYPIRPTDAWTISVWVRKPNLNAQTASIFAKRLNPGTAVREIHAYENGSTQVQGYAGNIGSTATYGGPKLSDGGWHLVTLRNDPTLAKGACVLFVDAGATAVATDTITNSGTATCVADLLLGAQRGASNAATESDWDGVVDDFRIYGRALSNAEIAALYSESAGYLNKAPAVSVAPAGPGVENASLALEGAVADDGLPAGSTLTSRWIKVSGPGNASFSAPAAADTSVTVDTAGTYVFRLSSSDGELSGADDVSVSFAPSSYTSWANGQNWGPGDDTSPAGDPDRDGLPNLLEYALGGDPVDAGDGPGRLPQGKVVEGHLAISFTRLRAELTYEVLACSDMAGWSVIATNPGEVGEPVTVQDPFPMSENPRRFLCLRVTGEP